MAKPVVYRALLGGFAGELGALKAQTYTFTVGAVADSAKLVFPRHTSRATVWAVAFLHLWAFFAAYSADANFHSKASVIGCYPII